MLQGPKDLLEKNGAVLKLDQMKIPIVGKYTKDQKQQNLSKTHYLSPVCFGHCFGLIIHESVVKKFDECRRTQPEGSRSGGPGWK